MRIKAFQFVLLLWIIIFLIGCTTPSQPTTTHKTPAKTQPSVQAQPDLKVVSKIVEKRATDIKVKGTIENKGNADASLVTVKAACNAVTEAVTNTGTDLIDVPAKDSASYSIIIPIAPYKSVDCDISLEY